MSKEKLLFCGQTDMGRQRTNNEDAFVVEQLDENTVLAIAIDGVGGYEGGEVAAAIAQKEIPAYMKKYNRGERLELLKQAVVSANNAIVERRQADAERANMSCVLTSALIDRERKVVDMVHVGDTRMYQFRHGELKKLSHDHSLIGYREEVGDLSEEEAMHHPQRNVISRDVGSELHEVEDSDFLEAEEFPLLPNSIFLFCSDGLTDLITSKQMVGILELPDSLETKAQMLIDAANEAGGKDNVTVVLVEYQAEEVAESLATKPIEEQSLENESKEVVPVTPERKKRCHKKWIVAMIVIIALLSGACAVWFIWTRLGQKEMVEPEEQMMGEPDITNIANPITDQMGLDTAGIKSIIKQYSNAFIENDFETISQLYAPQVRKYCGSCNLSNSQVIEKYKNYDRKFGVNSKHSEIRRGTLTIMQLMDGEIFVEYIEDYKIDRQDTTKPSNFVLLKHIVLDTNAKIVSFDDVTISENK